MALAQEAGSTPPALPALEPARLAHAQTFALRSRHTGQDYRIWLGLPVGEPGPRGYPALLALDGQAAFALMDPQRPRSGLPAREFTRLKRGSLAPGLVVGIGYASGDPVDIDARALDYTPPAGCSPCDQLSPRHGGADRFLDFIELELLPLLGRLYPLDPARRTLFGHSYGGLFTVHTLLSRPALFARYWASSPSLWFDDHALTKPLAARLERLGKPAGERRVHLAAGLPEQQFDAALGEERNRHLQSRRMLDNLRLLRGALDAARSHDWPGLRVSHEELAGHDHAAMFRQGCAAAQGFAFGDWPAA
ncbi:alpha/beta hydrolase [Roseateles sp. DAIF2]|uniref:alpha/beta hydrolase n=1 Tax=Roseateles sp. DAIF2 TaxID=2714952 RepID=UPI0018A281EA|nr:alpha/beta hydrolase-fold protein [Roseateles sp. DAIF2]QPF75296.1 alpha/beta hydrolase [Roseateles sp. DAIF2]